MRPGAPLKVAHLVSHPIHYFVPLYRELARRSDVDLTVYFYFDVTHEPFHDPGFDREIVWTRDLLAGYRSRICRSATRTDLGNATRRVHIDLLRELIAEDYDVIWTHGYAHLTTWLAVALARMRGMRLLLRTEQTLLERRSLHRRLLKEFVLPMLFRNASALYIGEQNRRYFLRYGMPEERLFPARYCVDNEWLRRRAVELAPQRAEVRAAFGITGDAPVVAFVGKLLEKKQPLFLLEAFRRVRVAHPCWLLLVGDGPLREQVDATIAGAEIPNVVRTGFVGQDDLPKAYVAADVFTLPSSHDETWGLVVGEAMNFSLPIVTTDKVGCAADLVRPGWNGSIVRHDDVASYAVELKALVADEERRRLFGSRSRAIVADYSVESCADGIVAACRAGRTAGAVARGKGVPSE